MGALRAAEAVAVGGMEEAVLVGRNWAFVVALVVGCAIAAEGRVIEPGGPVAETAVAGRGEGRLGVAVPPPPPPPTVF